MNVSKPSLTSGVIWTVAGYGASQLSRLGAIVILTRLLAPELFGIMAIINSVRTGLDLLSDFGLGQNVVQNKNADDPEFWNTAWSLQLIRGAILFFVCLAASLPLAHFYDTTILMVAIPMSALYFLFSSLNSISIFLVQRRLQLRKLNTFETSIEFISALAQVVLAYFSPTLWALVLGGLTGTAARMIGSYFLLPGLRHRFLISRKYAWQIFGFGKWVFLSSIVYFFSMNFDRLYLGKAAPLAMLGIYGLARSLADPLGAIVTRLGGYIVFPAIAASASDPRDRLRARISSSRLKLLLVAALGLACVASVGDWVVEILYDDRYQAAGWMLPILIVGVWLSILCTLSESTLMGFGKPVYGAIANALKCGYVVIGLPLGYLHYGILGAVIVITTSDLCRYIPLLVGQVRERCSFVRQDLITTLILFGLIASFGAVRLSLGLGTSVHALVTALPS
jgi:O-antigen/teichoic acid export membrane protein